MIDIWGAKLTTNFITNTTNFITKKLRVPRRRYSA